MNPLESLCIERARFTVTTQESAAYFREYHGTRLMGLLMRAWDSGSAHQLPIGLVPRPLAEGETTLTPGQPYHFDVVHAGPAPFDWSRLAAGISRVGAGDSEARWRFSVDAFAIERIPSPQATDGASDMVDVELELLSPLRMLRPNADQRPRHRFLDQHWFCGRTFLHRVASRIVWITKQAQPEGEDWRDIGPDVSHVTTLNVDVGWHDVRRGSDGRPSGGIRGHVRIRVPQDWLPWLRVAEWTHVGQGTHFGFGRVAMAGDRMA